MIYTPNLSANMAAFLEMIKFSEIGPALLAVSDDGYNVCVGSTPEHPILFTSYATHPDIYNAQLSSTAAGAFQLLYRYYEAYKAQLNLPDFSPASQEAIAMQQIKERNAVEDIEAGNLAAAIAACSSIWASFPGEPYGQGANSYASLLGAYQEAGGTVVA